MDETAKQTGEEINLDDEIEKAEREEGKTKFISEEKALQEIEGFLDKGVNDPAVLQGLAGLDSKQAWNLRYKYIENRTANIGFFVEGLAGVDSPAAINERQNILAMSSAHDSQIAQSLAGLDSKDAWDLREKLFRKVTEDEYLAEGLAGIDSPRAWQMRKELLDKGVSEDFLAKSLVGLDSKQAWDLREQILKDDILLDADVALQTYSNVVESLAGVDSKQAWALRDEFIKKFGYKDCLATSLVGIDSNEAWTLRKILVDECGFVNSVAQSLAGLDSQIAWTTREELAHNGADIDSLVLGINGNHISAIAWRKRQEWENAEEVQEVVEVEPVVLEDVVFYSKPHSRTGKIEYRSSVPDRKLVVLSEDSEIPEIGRPYKVQVIEDTQPDNSNKGKIIAKLYFESHEARAEDLVGQIN
ncbi:MAG: hypothetical protein EXS48_02680, partial [Candidatus Staskawiczbacteria bacterium]|nr:hypothetical protein [Candidatus Staskawiczbacteria bacterium]